MRERDCEQWTANSSIGVKRKAQRIHTAEKWNNECEETPMNDEVESGAGKRMKYEHWEFSE